MPSEHAEVLRKVFTEVVEKQAFAFAESAPVDDLPELEGAPVIADITFRGHCKGRMCIATPAIFCEEIAANVLGVEPDDPVVASGALDALQEMLNVTCGHVLTGIAGDKVVFDLTSPVGRKADVAAWEELKGRPETEGFVTDDDRPLLLFFKLDEPAR